MAKVATSYRLSDEAKRLLLAVSKKLGLTQAGVLETMIRRVAKEERVR